LFSFLFLCDGWMAGWLECWNAGAVAVAVAVAVVSDVYIYIYIYYLRQV
jgi:hypothetical protein